MLLLLLLIHRFSVLSLQLNKLRWHNESAIDLSNINPARGYKEVRRSTSHVIVTTRYSSQQRSKSQQTSCRIRPSENIGNLSATRRCLWLQTTVSTVWSAASRSEVSQNGADYIDLKFRRHCFDLRANGTAEHQKKGVVLRGSWGSRSILCRHSTGYSYSLQGLIILFHKPDGVALIYPPVCFYSISVAGPAPFSPYPATVLGHQHS